MLLVREPVIYERNEKIYFYANKYTDKEKNNHSFFITSIDLDMSGSGPFLLFLVLDNFSFFGV